MNPKAERSDGTQDQERLDRSRRWSLLALSLIVPAQSLGVATMLFGIPGPTGILLNGLSRLWMIGFPIVWWIQVEGRSLRLNGPSRSGLLAGIVSGVLIFFLMLSVYLLLADQMDLDRLRHRGRLTGFDRPALFAGMFAFIIFGNSLLEEFVWRGFVFRQLEVLMPVQLGTFGIQAAAVLVAALLFTVHHVIALAAWVDGFLVVLGSLGVFLGAVVWSILYAYDRTLWPSYVSHILADLAILAMGYDLMFGKPW